MTSSSAFVTHGCCTKVTDRKLFVIERQHDGCVSRQINRGDPSEAVRSAPDASDSGSSPARCCSAPTPLVCATASVRRGRDQRARADARSDYEGAAAECLLPVTD